MSDNLITIVMEQFRGLRLELQDHRREAKSDAMTVRDELQTHRREVKADAMIMRGELNEKIENLRTEINSKIDSIEKASKPALVAFTKAQGAWILIGLIVGGLSWAAGIYKVFGP